MANVYDIQIATGSTYNKNKGFLMAKIPYTDIDIEVGDKVLLSGIPGLGDVEANVTDISKYDAFTHIYTDLPYTDYNTQQGTIEKVETVETSLVATQEQTGSSKKKLVIGGIVVLVIVATFFIIRKVRK